MNIWTTVCALRQTLAFCQFRDEGSSRAHMCENCGSANRKRAWKNSTCSFILPVNLRTALFYGLLLLNKHYQWSATKIIAADRWLTRFDKDCCNYRICQVKSIFCVQNLDSKTCLSNLSARGIRNGLPRTCNYKHRSDKVARTILTPFQYDQLIHKRYGAPSELQRIVMI